jgi:hypothetical protein
MFRKVTHIIISLVLLISTTGLSISEHYCGNEKIHITLNSIEKECCEIPTDCCHDEIKLLQLKGDFTKPPGIIQLNITEFNLSEFPTLLLFVDNLVVQNTSLNILEYYIPGRQDVLHENQSLLL